MAIALKPLDQQRIVITGASSGIGLATAKAAGKAGAKVMLAARDEVALSEIAAEIRAEGGEADFQVTDVSVEAEVEALAEAAITRFGGFDTWVNNAGVEIIGSAEETTSSDHHRIFEVNYFGVVYGSLAATRHFRDMRQPSALINLGSAVSDMPIIMSVAYSATKHAIKGFTDGLRLELQREGLPVSVTLIKPSSIDTPIFDHAKTYGPGLGQAPGPDYAPSVVADAILYAARHEKRDIAVGSTAALGGRVAAAMPWFIDRTQRRMPIDTLIDFGRQPTANSLDGIPEEGHERSRFGSGRKFSVTTLAQTRTGLTSVAVLAGVGAMALLISGARAAAKR